MPKSLRTVALETSRWSAMCWDGTGWAVSMYDSATMCSTRTCRSFMFSMLARVRSGARSPAALASLLGQCDYQLVVGGLDGHDAKPVALRKQPHVVERW